MNTAVLNNQAQIHKDITRSRSTVLSYILKIKKCLDARHNDLLEALTKRFSENTIDYISCRHFRLFQDHRLEPHQVAALESITQQVLQFDNRYARRSQFPTLRFREDLERLTFALEARFELEDELMSYPTT